MSSSFELRLWQAGELVKELGEPEFLIESLLIEGSQALLYAPTGWGKSFVAVDIACHIATGTPFHGLPVKQGPVVYVAAEAPLEIEKRVMAWERFQDKKTTDLKIINVPIQLNDPDQMEALIHQAINKTGASLVVFDNAERVAIGTDENLPTEVNRDVNAPISEMISRTGVTSLLVHHAGVSGTRPRGCTAWESPNDTIIKVNTKFALRKNRSQPSVVTIQVEKQRGSEPISLNLGTQSIPFRSGMSTLVLVDAEYKPVVETPQRELTKLEKVLGMLSEGSFKTQEIADAVCDGNIQSARNILSNLKKKGQAINVSEGLWELT